jgi:hypothetical protein
VCLSIGKRPDKYAHAAVSGEKILSCWALGYFCYFTCQESTFLDAKKGWQVGQCGSEWRGFWHVGPRLLVTLLFLYSASWACAFLEA